MDGFSAPERIRLIDVRVAELGTRPRRWRAHAAHSGIAIPHERVRPWAGDREELRVVSAETPSRDDRRGEVVLDGSRGEGGGQILRSALTLSLLTGRPFRMTKIRANREQPGLRPQHHQAVEAAASLGAATVSGSVVGSRQLTFRPGAYTARDLSIAIGTAGSAGLVLQTLHLPLAMKTDRRVQLVLSGGTFNPKAPAFPFLDWTWTAFLAAFGSPISLKMLAAGFYPRGGGRIEALIEPAELAPFQQIARGPLRKIRGVAGVANLREDIAARMRDRAIARLEEQGLSAEIELVRWPSPGQGAAIALVAEHEGSVPATFVGLGERGKMAETVADEAIDELLEFESVRNAAVDPHSADQILLPLAFAPGRSEFTVSMVTEHLRTNVETISAFLDRAIYLKESGADNEPSRVVIA
jgi:RNA 3'-terminal phosphate cyclase (ATP)